MKRAIKKSGKLVKAYRLGDSHSVTRKLIKEGKICQIDKNTFELYSQEASNGIGEIARRGDWYKLDSANCPYPNSRDYFEAHHKFISIDQYEQIPEEVYTWNLERDGLCQEAEYLLKTGKLIINEEDEKHYYNAELWGTFLSAAKDAIIVFYKILKNKEGIIEEVDFNFVEKSEFYETYKVLD